MISDRPPRAAVDRGHDLPDAEVPETGVQVWRCAVCKAEAVRSWHCEFGAALVQDCITEEHRTVDANSRRARAAWAATRASPTP